MGEVLTFQPRVKPKAFVVVRGSDIEPAPVPAWRRSLQERYFDLANWSLSRKGNPFLRVGDLCVTVFPRKGGWSWSIYIPGRVEPMWSQDIWIDEHDARVDAWKALTPLAAPKDA